MYLTPAAPASQPEPENPARAPNRMPGTGLVRWTAGAQGCDQFTSPGRKVESATANGLTVQVSLQDTGWKLHASVAVSNGSGSQIFVLPALVTLDELTPKLRKLRQENPTNLARNETKHHLMHIECIAVPPPTADTFRS